MENMPRRVFPDFEIIEGLLLVFPGIKLGIVRNSHQLPEFKG